MTSKRTYPSVSGFGQRAKLLAWAASSLMVFAFSALAHADILIDNFTNDTNDRFTNSAGFIGAGLDFSGVGRANTSGRWGTLISRNAVLSARHAAPTAGTSFFFYEGNDPAGPKHEAVVTEGFFVGSTDLYIAILDRNVDSSIKVYDFATEDLLTDPNSGGSIDLADAGSWQDLNAYMFGISPTGPIDRDREIDIAVGRNQITGYDENVPFLAYSDNDVLLLEYNAAADAEYSTNEAVVQGGDSGAPLFVEVGGELVLLGVNSFRADLNPQVDFIASGITYTGNIDATINTILNDNAIAVPEPASAALIGLMVAAFGVSRRRR